MNSQGYTAIIEKERNALPSLLKKKNSTLVQLFRYALVGGCAYTIDFGALFFLTDYLQIHYLGRGRLLFRPFDTLHSKYLLGFF